MRHLGLLERDGENVKLTVDGRDYAAGDGAKRAEVIRKRLRADALYCATLEWMHYQSKSSATKTDIANYWHDNHASELGGAKGDALTDSTVFFMRMVGISELGNFVPAGVGRETHLEMDVERLKEFATGEPAQGEDETPLLQEPKPEPEPLAPPLTPPPASARFSLARDSTSTLRFISPRTQSRRRSRRSSRTCANTSSTDRIRPLMAADGLPPGVKQLFAGLSRLQAEFDPEVADVGQESPAAALVSLETAVAGAPAAYRPYLEEALACYREALYRAAILMVWSAIVQHLYLSAASHRGGVAAVEKANKARFGQSKTYRAMRKPDDFLYLGEHAFHPDLRRRRDVQPERPSVAARAAQTEESLRPSDRVRSRARGNGRIYRESALEHREWILAQLVDRQSGTYRNRAGAVPRARCVPIDKRSRLPAAPGGADPIIVMPMRLAVRGPKAVRSFAMSTQVGAGIYERVRSQDLVLGCRGPSLLYPEHPESAPSCGRTQIARPNRTPLVRSWQRSLHPPRWRQAVPRAR